MNHPPKDKFERDVLTARERTLSLAQDLVAAAIAHQMPLSDQVIAGIYCTAGDHYRSEIHHVHRVAPLSSQMLWLEALAPCCAVYAMVSTEVLLTTLPDGQQIKRVRLSVRDVKAKHHSLLRDYVSDGMIGAWIVTSDDSILHPFMMAAFNLQGLRMIELKNQVLKGQ